MTITHLRCVLLAVAGSVLAGVLLAPAAWAAGPQITQPKDNPIRVSLDAQGHAIPFTVIATGYAHFQPVFLQQCDGRAPTTPGWSPAADCDIAASGSPVYADAHGVASFDAANQNRALKVFVGPSPQGLFNCLPPHASSPKNGMPDFHGCYIRVATDPAKVSSDQILVPIVLGTGSDSSGSNSTRSAVVIALIAVLVVVLVVFAVVWMRGRKSVAKT